MGLALLPLVVALAQGATPEGADSPPAEGTVILFLVDNSASLPPLDPGEKRVDALEKMFSFLDGEPYRLILFGGREEVSVDEITRYRNDGQWTDFYHALRAARDLMASYPEDVSFRMVLVTDGVLDPRPGDWPDVPEGRSLQAHASLRIDALLREMRVPLYVILVGTPPVEALTNREQAPSLVLEMVAAANGALASPRAQSLSEFFEDDGMLLKKFVYRVKPEEGLARIEPVVRRIVASSSPGVELRFLSALVLPLVLLACLLLGILVRSFPGPGDVEVVELGSGAPVHVAADRFHKVAGGGWSGQGLSLVASAKEAAGTLSYEAPSIDLSGRGIAVAPEIDPTLRRLFTLNLDELRKAIRDLSLDGTKDEKIFVLNLNYMAASFDAVRAERVLTAGPANRGGHSPLEFLQAKAHLLVNNPLRQKLTDARVHFQGYGREAVRKELTRDSDVRIGRYTFRVKALAKGGRKDVQLILSYEKVPSLLGLKNLLPEAFQRVVRFRRSNWRVVRS
jgi:hypothetical protein